MSESRKDTLPLAQDLPQELLGEIFVWCRPKNAFDDFQPNSSLPPLVFGRVCSSWRKAALGTPQLWAELSMELGLVIDQILHTRLSTLEFWGSHMGVLLPSVHFRCKPDFWSREEGRKLVPFREFFQSPVILNAQSLTLDGFCLLAQGISFPRFNIPFRNLEYLATSHFNSHRLPLRRLHIDYFTNSIGHPSGFLTAFPWVTITHLCANLCLYRQEWYALLAQLLNLISWSGSLEILADANSGDRGATRFHHNLRTLSVQGGAETLVGIFDGFSFPCLVALRLSWINSTITFDGIHQAIAATPALKELHLQPDRYSNLPHQPQTSQLDGPLSKFAPSLLILVIDRLKAWENTNSTTRDTLRLLHSNWLNDGWTTRSRTPMRVEVNFRSSRTSNSVVENLKREIGLCGSLPFHVSARYVSKSLWKTRRMNARELRDHWDDILAFRYN